MCGINGIIFKTSKSDVSKILKMNALLDHRGPDDSRFINHKNLLLGHTRLSIIDTSNLGSQPMSVDGRYWIIYNLSLIHISEPTRPLYISYAVF